ncbi:hypothetical protein T265_08569 [Opisthorchis viverrini]|uniref:Uncharacterized protein n=1 Tax=Opisthorchis viverrini TaxID=6198 RepID=A0A074ZD46_OPIVI|nr:hypothetical protein T265_08569 [Opisthorchis viverrini]KER23577.1 hypothetical protein T265_08569 [Opisthorchis viverrini]
MQASEDSMVSNRQVVIPDLSDRSGPRWNQETWNGKCGAAIAKTGRPLETARDSGFALHWLVSLANGFEQYHVTGWTGGWLLHKAALLRSQNP